MKPEHAQLIADAAETIGGDIGVRLHTNYSGRGMYGKATVAVEGDLSAILQCVALAAHELEDRDKLDEFMLSLAVRSDAMGHSMVIY